MKSSTKNLLKNYSFLLFNLDNISNLQVKKNAGFTVIYYAIHTHYIYKKIILLLYGEFT